jgi:hypothetical protein
MTAPIKLVPMQPSARRGRRRLVFTCLASVSMGLSMLAALMWWDSKTWDRRRFIGNWEWASIDDKFILIHYGSRPRNGLPDSLFVPINVRNGFSYATREWEQGESRVYAKEFRAADWFLCTVFGILPAVWFVGVLRRRLASKP